jgi:hypothetical protein
MTNVTPISQSRTLNKPTAILERRSDGPRVVRRRDGGCAEADGTGDFDGQKARQLDITTDPGRAAAGLPGNAPASLIRNGLSSQNRRTLNCHGRSRRSLVIEIPVVGKPGVDSVTRNDDRAVGMRPTYEFRKRARLRQHEIGALVHPDEAMAWQPHEPGRTGVNPRCPQAPRGTPPSGHQMATPPSI